MLVTIDKDGEFFVVKYFGSEIIRKTTMVQATKALAKFCKGRE